jgi:hypothetical protein
VEVRPGVVVGKHLVQLDAVELSHGVLLDGADPRADALSCHSSLPTVSVWNLLPRPSGGDRSATDPNATSGAGRLRQPDRGASRDTL